MSNQESVSRRKFMGSAALAGAAVSFPNVLTAESKGKEVIRFALIGCGGRGKGAAAQVMNLPHKTECVALADAFMDTAKGAQNYLKHVGHEDKLKLSDDTIFAGLDAYKKVMEMDNVDLVLLTTSPGFRPLHFEHAVNKGKHVFMEKPVATDGAGVRRVLAANEEAKKKNLMVTVGLQRHHEDNYIETVKRVQDGAIGELNMPEYFGIVEEFGRRKEHPVKMNWSTRFVTGFTLIGFAVTTLWNSTFTILISLIGSRVPILSKPMVMAVGRFVATPPMILTGKTTVKFTTTTLLSLNMLTGSDVQPVPSYQ